MMVESQKMIQPDRPLGALNSASEASYIYQITIQGRLELHWGDWFDGMQIRHTENGDTVLSGPIPDQSALHGILARARDLGLVLLSLQRIESDI